jgi:hypothetical protein
MSEKVFRIMKSVWYERGVPGTPSYYVQVKKSFCGFKYWSSIKEPSYESEQTIIRFKSEQEAYEMIERLKNHNKVSGHEVKVVWADPEFKNMQMK